MKLGTSGVMDAQLADVLDSAWQLLRRGAADRRSPLHVPVVAGGGGARTMVMRAAVRADGVLRFHTDARSP